MNTTVFNHVNVPQVFSEENEKVVPMTLTFQEFETDVIRKVNSDDIEDLVRDAIHQIENYFKRYNITQP